MIIVLGRICDELGGSEHLTVSHGLEIGAVPEVNMEEEKGFIPLLWAITSKKLFISCHDISGGDLLACLTESAIQGYKGLQVQISSAGNRSDGRLFSGAPGQTVMDVDPTAGQHSMPMTVSVVIGEPFGLSLERKQVFKIPMAEMTPTWGEAIECGMK